MKGYYKKRGRFLNPHVGRIKPSLFDIALWQLGIYRDPQKPEACPKEFIYPNPKESLSPSKPKATWINHSTFLIEVGGLTLLTDPIWEERCSPLKFIGPKRNHPPPISLDQLPKVDLVLISHDHYDHLCFQTVSKLQKKNPELIWIVPLGVKRRLLRMGMQHILELEWWQEVSLAIHGKGFVVTSVPSQHFSGRGLFDKNRTLWTGYVIDLLEDQTPPKRLYFAGDTGYNKEDFKEIGEKFNGIDLSLIPIGSYIPRCVMQPIHICPIHAALIHEEVRSKLSIGMHWKTFRLSGETLEQPPYDLFCELKKKKIDPLHFRVLEPGQTINW